MSETITLNGVDRSSVIQRKNLELVENAYLGEVATGRAQIDDAAGTITVAAYKSATVEQSSSTPSRIFSGFTHRKGIRRGETYTTGAGREYDVTLVDGNDLLRRRIIRQRDGDSAAEGGKRPAETVGERVTWLLASGFLAASDFGAVTYPDIGMTKTDYRNSNYPGDVLAACAKAVRFNYYIRWNVAHSDWELVFRDDNASTDDTCTLSISNDMADVNNSTVFAPFMESELSQDPEDVYSGTIANHGRGSIYRHRASTASAFTERDGVTDDAGTTDGDVAARDAETFLDQSADEEQILPVTLRLKAAHVGLVKAGMRISTRMTHMAPEGWDPAQYARILRLKITQPLNTDNDYDLAIDLSPQEAGPAAPAIVQRAYHRNPFAGTYDMSLPNPVTPGHHLIWSISCATGGTGALTPPTFDPAFGPTAWTEYDAVYTSSDNVGAVGIWWKEAEVTNQTIRIPGYSAVELLEIDGFDPASAFVQSEERSQTGTTYAMDSLGAVADGSLAIAVFGLSQNPNNWPWDYANSYAYQTPNPNAGAPAAWDTLISQWSYDHYSLSAYLPTTHWHVLLEGTGDGSTVFAPQLTPGRANNQFGAVAVVIPPA